MISLYDMSSLKREIYTILYISPDFDFTANLSDFINFFEGSPWSSIENNPISDIFRKKKATSQKLIVAWEAIFLSSQHSTRFNTSRTARSGFPLICCRHLLQIFRNFLKNKVQNSSVYSIQSQSKNSKNK